MVKYSVIFLLSLFMASPIAFAAETKSAPDQNIDLKLQQQLKQKMKSYTGLDVISVNQSAMPGLLELITKVGVFYSSVDGKFLLEGKLYGIENNGMIKTKCLKINLYTIGVHMQLTHLDTELLQNPSIWRSGINQLK